MNFREWLKQFVPMSSRSLNARLDNLFHEIEKFHAEETQMEKSLRRDLDGQLKRLPSATGKELASLWLETQNAKEAHAAEDLLKDIQRRLTAIEMRLQALETNGNQLKTLSYNHLDPELYPHSLRLWYQDVSGNPLNLENPETYNEKIQWMKVYDHDPLKTRLSDKYLVRDWIKEKIGEEYLIPLLAVYRSADEIDFNSLPDSFVLKANHGSAMNCIVRNKSAENLNAIRSRAKGWLSKNFSFANGYELHYNDIPRRLIVEKYMENMDGDMPDYKFWCFDGKCRFIEYIKDRRNGGYIAMFDPEWNRLPFVIKPYKKNENDIPMPEKMPEMVRIAERLAEGFPHVRVDLYLLDDGEIKFGEMTFTSRSGNCKWDPPEADLWVGRMFSIHKKE